MPIGKWEIVLKVQKEKKKKKKMHSFKSPYSSREQSVSWNFSALTVRAISYIIKLYIPIHRTTTSTESLSVLLLLVCSFPTPNRGLWLS